MNANARKYRRNLGGLGVAVWAAAGFVLGVGFSSGCKQGEGDRCEQSADCDDGLECCLGEQTQYPNTCRRKCNPCGDGVLDSGEACDDGNNVSNDGCKGDCSSNETCGNRIVDDHLRDPNVAEECDPPTSQPPNEVVACEDLGFVSGNATCMDNCLLDLSSCVGGCGNGVLEPEFDDEECDGAELGGATCQDLGFAGGTLGCTEGCRYDLAGCTGGCGNGVLESSEQCDTDNLDGKSCEDLGFSGGTLRCGGTCIFDTSGCTGRSAVDVNVDSSGFAAQSGSNTGEADLMTASCQPNGGAEALFLVTVEQSGYYLLATEPISDASALQDTVLSMWDEATSDASELMCNDNDGVGRLSALMTFLDSAGGGAYFAVEGYGGSEGAFQLVVRSVLSPSGTCAWATALSAEGSYGARIDALGDSNLQTGSCFGAGSAEAVFVYTMQGAGSLRVTAESIGDMPFGVYLRTTACDGGTAVEEDCAIGDFAGTVAVASGLSASDPVYIFVEGNTEDVVVPVLLWIEEQP
jgi:cysteine-rich repeat protein